MRTVLRAAVLVALALTSLWTPSLGMAAGASDYVVTPIVEDGEREIDFKAGMAKLPENSRESAYSIGLGWGVRSWWFSEVYAKWHKEPRASNAFDAWEWENKFQLTETGKYPVDIGLLLEVERPQLRSEGYEYRWGPLFQSDITPSVQANLNVLLTKHIRTATPGNAVLGYQWQLKYRWHPELEYGLQGFGDVGPWNHWLPKSEQSHIAGPAIFGRFRVAEHQVIKYNAGLLVALTAGAPRKTFRIQAEYEF